MGHGFDCVVGHAARHHRGSRLLQQRNHPWEWQLDYGTERNRDKKKGNCTTPRPPPPPTPPPPPPRTTPLTTPRTTPRTTPLTIDVAGCAIALNEISVDAVVRLQPTGSHGLKHFQHRLATRCKKQNEAKTCNC